jgi:hypothetical protein
MFHSTNLYGGCQVIPRTHLFQYSLTPFRRHVPLLGLTDCTVRNDLTSFF